VNLPPCRFFFPMNRPLRTQLHRAACLMYRQ